MDKTARMKELIAKLTEASRAYYAEDREIMSNYEYDRLYDELEALEKETGTVLAGSPTVTVGYEAVDELPKERHERPMLSLGKTKSREELRDWLGNQKGLLSWKLDGLTVVLTYRDGTLFKAVTRGNGEIGEVITPNAKVFVNIPLVIPFKGELVLRGEAGVEGDVTNLLRRLKHMRLKSKTLSGDGVEITYEIRLERQHDVLINKLLSIPGVQDATLVSYANETL